MTGTTTCACKRMVNPGWLGRQDCCRPMPIHFNAKISPRSLGGALPTLGPETTRFTENSTRTQPSSATHSWRRTPDIATKNSSPLNSSVIIFKLERQSGHAFTADQAVVLPSAATYLVATPTTTITQVLEVSTTPTTAPKKAAAPGSSENVDSSVLDNTSNESAIVNESNSKRAIEAHIADSSIESAEIDEHDRLGLDDLGPRSVHKPSAIHLEKGAYGIAQDIAGASSVPGPASIGHKLEITVDRVAPGWPVQKFIVNLPSDSSAQEYTIDSPGFLKTKGEVASGYQLMLKALYNTTAEKIPAHYLRDTSANPGQELENLTRDDQDQSWGITGALKQMSLEHLTPEQHNELRRYLGHQQAVLEAIFSRHWASLSRDPEKNQEIAKKNGGFMWLRVCLDDGEVDYNSDMAVSGPAPARHLSGRPGYSIEKLRPIWVSAFDHGPASGPAAHFIFNFTSTELENMHPDERVLYVEVFHVSDARAKDLKDVVTLEGPNVLRPDLRYFLRVKPVPFMWSDAMVELNPDRFGEVREESVQEEKVIPPSRAERRRQQREADTKFKRNGQSGGGDQKKSGKN